MKPRGIGCLIVLTGLHDEYWDCIFTDCIGPENLFSAYIREIVRIGVENKLVHQRAVSQIHIAIHCVVHLARFNEIVTILLRNDAWGLVRSMGDSFQASFELGPAGVPSVTQAMPALQRLTLQLALAAERKRAEAAAGGPSRLRERHTARGLELLELLSVDAQWRRLSDISAALALPKGPLHRLLAAEGLRGGAIRIGVCGDRPRLRCGGGPG